MNIRVLGCHGGELPGFRTTCFLLDGRVTVDAGTLVSVLPLAQLAALDHVFLTHSHFDHVKDLPLLCDVLPGRRTKPLLVHGTAACLRTLAGSVFNGELWPDFRRIPSPEAPVVAFAPLALGVPVEAGALALTAVPAAHPVDAVGYVARDAGGAVAFSGDTGPDERFWRIAGELPQLRALFVELSFPDRLQALADVSGHLTPATLAPLLRGLRRDVPVLLYHLKPALLPELREAVAALGDRRLRILAPGDEFDF